MCDDARNYISILTIKLSQLSSIRISISMYVCVLCVCVCVRACVCAYVRVCMHICMHVSVYIRMHVSMYVHVCMHMCMHMCTRVSMHTYISAIKISHLQYWHNVIIHRKATYVHQKQTSSGLYYSVIFPCFLSIVICGGTTFVWEQKLSHHEWNNGRKTGVSWSKADLESSFLEEVINTYHNNVYSVLSMLLMLGMYKCGLKLRAIVPYYNYSTEVFLQWVVILLSLYTCS